MVTEQRRSSQRRQHKGPLRYLHDEMDQYYDATMYNYCEQGFYFEVFEPLDRDDRLHIIIPDHRSGVNGPARFPYYLSRVRWCRELESLRTPRFGVGVNILEKGHDLRWLPDDSQNRTCDLCEGPLTAESVCRIDGRFCLCPDCFFYVEEMPDGTVKENIMRRMVGNII